MLDQLKTEMKSSNFSTRGCEKERRARRQVIIWIFVLEIIGALSWCYLLPRHTHYRQKERIMAMVRYDKENSAEAWSALQAEYAMERNYFVQRFMIATAVVLIGDGLLVLWFWNK